MCLPVWVLVLFCFSSPAGSLSPAETSGFGVDEGSSSSNKENDSENINNSGTGNSGDLSSSSADPLNASATPADATSDPLAEFDDETRGILAEAKLSKMPATSAEWAKFERVKKGAFSRSRCF